MAVRGKERWNLKKNSKKSSKKNWTVKKNGHWMVRVRVEHHEHLTRTLWTSSQASQGPTVKAM